MPMAVRLARGIVGRVFVVMVGVVFVSVLVLEFVVGMFVRMTFAQQQRDPK